jgi:hypothetical protein
MIARAFLLGFFAGPLPFTIWSALLHRTSHPDTLGLNFGGLVMTLPLLYVLARVSRRPMYLVTWFATAGTFFWASVSWAARHGRGAGAVLGSVAVFPISGWNALAAEEAMLFAVLLMTWGILAGFASILRRSHAPMREREKRPPAPPPREEPPEEEPYFVVRPPERPKGPSYTPPSKPEEAPREKRVPGR